MSSFGWHELNFFIFILMSFLNFFINLFFRKYDDIVSVNQESVVGDNVAKVKKLLKESETDLNLVCAGDKHFWPITMAIYKTILSF